MARGQDKGDNGRWQGGPGRRGLCRKDRNDKKRGWCASMQVGFPQSVRALSRDNSQRWLWRLGIGLVLLTLWGGWFVYAQLSVYVTSRQARVEVFRQVHPVEAQVDGQVVASRLELGAEVQRGDVLVELDVELQRLELEEREARVAASEAELRAFERLVEAEKRVIGQMDEAAQAALEEADARVEEAEAAAAFAASRAKRLASLRRKGHLSELEVLEAQTEAKQKQASAQAERLAYQRQVADHKARTGDRLSRIAEVQQDVVRLEGEIRVGQASIRRLERDIARRRVRAPVAGKLGEVSTLPVGAVVSAGQQIAAVVPPGELKVVGQFTASEAVGRLKPGQKARVRLDAFPWTQYGSVSGRVARVASEPREGLVRVEVVLDEASSRRIPYEHGLNGSVEVAVEQATPFTLVLRVVGKAAGSAPTALGDMATSGVAGNGPGVRQATQGL